MHSCVQLNIDRYAHGTMFFVTPDRLRYGRWSSLDEAIHHEKSLFLEVNRNLNSWLAARHIPSELDKAAKLELIESLRDRRAFFYRQLAKQHFLQHVGKDLYF